MTENKRYHYGLNTLEMLVAKEHSPDRKAAQLPPGKAMKSMHILRYCLKVEGLKPDKSLSTAEVASWAALPISSTTQKIQLYIMIQQCGSK